MCRTFPNTNCRLFVLVACLPLTFFRCSQIARSSLCRCRRPPLYSEWPLIYIKLESYALLTHGMCNITFRHHNLVGQRRGRNWPYFQHNGGIVCVYFIKLLYRFAGVIVVIRLFSHICKSRKFLSRTPYVNFSRK